MLHSYQCEAVMKSVSVSDLKNNPSQALRVAKAEPVVIMNRDHPQALLVDLNSLEIPDTESLKLALALHLNQAGQLSEAKAARIAGVSLEDFLKARDTGAGRVEDSESAEKIDNNWPPDQPPIVDRTSEVWTITLCRPRQHNRLDPQDVDLLQTVFDEVLTTSQRPRILIFRGTGLTTFSSGYTLQAIVGQLDERFERMLNTLESLPILTQAAMQGNVYGGATDLALCCDIRLGPADARMFMPAARIGLHYYPHGMRRYLHRLGYAAASKLFLSAMTIHADEMLRIGFLTEVVSPANLNARVQEHIDAALATEPQVIETMKASLREMAALPETVMEQARIRYLASLQGPQLASRLKALGK
jgi:enoyl-CoA hydratase/carnithine racemase/PHD/YefM family antitoxin component YafN of YafNO toxin-antitoxin module